MTKHHTSMIVYLSSRITLPMLIIMLCWLGVSKYSYEFALDDSAAHYLYYDAEQVNSQRLTLPISDEFKLITQSHAELPDYVVQAWRSGQLAINQVTLLRQANQDIYVLPWQQPNSNVSPLFVLHFFDPQDTLPITPWLTLLLAACSLLALYTVIRSTLKINKQINALTEFVNTNKQSSEVTRFKEFSAFYDALKLSRQAEQLAHQKERLLSTYLSHEVRTPLTHIQHSIARLQQQDDLPLEAVDILLTLEQAQHRLSDTSSAVLALWQTDIEKQLIDIRAVIRRVAARYDNQHFQIILELNPHEVILPLHTPLCELLLTQAIENAQRHGKPPLTIKLTPETLTLHNAQSAQNQDTSGTGLGSMLIQQICTRLDWHRSISVTTQDYTLTIKFKALY
ncbi:sensor histidine kinase [Pseudoalteromonas sp. T1lg23B]|uniref:sensor histidine kinase n=1 Tax=Pseudoalteromonas sp. T1lg23B TaxID=2077097 RepID=UPI000CF6ACAD|nr:HAMP domain-containing histidine kinase [Pseudoalteromonas sp. T1lg23B]